MAASMERPLSIAILALGGQGGGVLTKWLVDIAQSNGYLAQSTYVAGVAQRTGATVYCIELFPEDRARQIGKEPVFTPYPIPGDVDLVVVGEFAETGRAIQKGFVTPNVTILIASSHRVYSIEEKSALENGIIDQAPVEEAAQKAARKFISFDMEAVATQTNSVISAVMLGAIAASGALPFERNDYEEVIRSTGKAVQPNLAGFEQGFNNASQPPLPAEKAELMPARGEGPNGQALIKRILEEFPGEVQVLASHGALRVLGYQDKSYADLYLERLSAIIDLDRSNGGDRLGYALSSEVARQLALQMCYEDTIRVAEIKTSISRFDEVHRHLNVRPDQPVHVLEYLHPRLEEVCDTLPEFLGRRIMASDRSKRVLAPLFKKGRTITTTNIFGFLLLACVARLKRWRPGTYRFAIQTRFINAWLDRISTSVSEDYEYALSIAKCMGVVKGYGDTYERGLSRYQKSVQVSQKVPVKQRAQALRALHQAALADEDGRLFEHRVIEWEAV